MSKKKVQDLIEMMNVEWEEERKQYINELKDLTIEVQELKKIIFTFEKICKKVRTKSEKSKK